MEKSLGEYIHSLRKEHGLTLTKLAAALDIDKSTLSKVENNKRNLPDAALPKIANYFGLDVTAIKREYYSEKIAEMIYQEPNCREVLKLAEEKVEYMKSKNSRIKV